MAAYGSGSGWGDIGRKSKVSITAFPPYPPPLPFLGPFFPLANFKNHEKKLSDFGLLKFQFQISFHLSRNKLAS